VCFENDSERKLLGEEVSYFLKLIKETNGDIAIRDQL